MNIESFRNYHAKEFYNEILFESTNFIVIPSLGSLVEGWLLIVPKTEYLSLRCICDDELLSELDILANSVKDVLVREYGGVVMFEHGAINKNSTVGCGVDYAHLHLVPSENNLIRGLEDFLDIKYDWKSVINLKEAILSLDISKEYLFYRDVNGDSFIAQENAFPSQLFRKVIAHYINMSEEFDWKKNYGIGNIHNTISKLKMINSHSKQQLEVKF